MAFHKHNPEEQRILDNPFKSGSDKGCNCQTCNDIRNGVLIPKGAGFVRQEKLRQETEAKQNG